MLTVVSTSGGSVTVSPGLDCASGYLSGRVVTLTAVPDAGYVVQWSGDLSGSANPASIVMDAPKTVTATFVQSDARYTIAVEVTSADLGTVTLTPTQPPEGYRVNQPIMLTASPANTCYTFSHWEGDLTGNGNPASIIVNAHKTITAVFSSYVCQTDFSADKTMAVVGQSIQFTDESTGTATSWHWDFGDGETSTLQNPSHSYLSVGDYSVSLTVTSPAGAHTETKTGYITVYPKLQAEFSVSTVESRESQIIVFFINTSSGGVPPLTYAWDFENDGTIDGTEREPWHYYGNTGTYTVRLVVTDSAENTEVKVEPNCLTIFSSDGGTAETVDGQVRTEFPPGAVEGAAMVTIGTRTAAGLPDVPESFIMGGTCFTILAVDDSGNEIIALSQPTAITVKYSEADAAAAGGNPNRLVLAYWDETAGCWKELKTSVGTANMTLSASTTHLSTWAVLAKSPSEGLASWIWIVIGIAAAAGAGMVAYFVRRRLSPKV